MFPTKWILPLVCVTGSLSAQAIGDLNGLITSAAHYASHGLGGTRDAQALELCKISGDNGGNPERLMTRSVDVVHWNFLYRIKTALAEGDSQPAEALPKPHRSVLTECTNGVFGGFKYSASMVTGVKSLEYTWIAIPLAEAISQLNNFGYLRGFDKVTLMRPANPSLPEEYVYVFNCPWERTQVAISTQTGALSWRATY